jgi:hypothetical protein
MIDDQQIAIAEATDFKAVAMARKTEPSPSNRDDEFYERCRFDEFEHALAAAQRVCLAESPPVAEALLRLRQPA